MCGFIGCVHEKPQVYQDAEKQLFQNMNNIITRRVPTMMAIILTVMFNLAFAD